MDSNKKSELWISSGENVVDEIVRVFISSDFVREVEVSNPIHVLITTKGYDRKRRKALYAVQRALMEKYPRRLFDFNVLAGEEAL